MAKKAIVIFLNRVTKRVRRQHLLIKVLIGMTISLICSFILTLLSLMVVIPHTLEKCLLIVIGGLLISLVYGMLKAPKKQDVARLLDATGLEERVSTALMLINEESMRSKLQQEDTWEHLKQYDMKQHFPWKLPLKRIGINLLLILGISVLMLIPTKAKLLEKEWKNFEKEKSKLQRQLEAAKKEINEVGNLTEKEKIQIGELLENTLQEIPKTEKQSEVEKTMQRLDKKLEKVTEQVVDEKGKEQLQSIQRQLTSEFAKKMSENAKKDLSALKDTLEKNKLTKPLADTLMSDLADQKAIEEAARALQEQLSKLSDAEKKALAQTFKEAADKVSDASLANYLATASQEILQQQLSMEEMEAALNQLKNMAQNNKQNQGEGQNQWQGQSQGQGENQGSGNGSGWDTGSKNGKQEESNGSIGSPTQMLENNDITQLSGQIDHETQIKQEEIPYGLNIAGEKIDYHEVVGEYSDKALESIEEETMPEQMKEVIKTYFEAINE